MRPKHLILVLLVALVAYGGYRLFPSDEAVIRKMLHEAAEAASVPPDQSNLGKLTAVNRLLNLCAPDIRIVVSAPGIETRVLQGKDELRNAVAAVKGTQGGLQVSLRELTVNVHESGERASSQFIAQARTRDYPEDIFQEFIVQFKKLEGDWKIQTVEPLQALGP